MVTRRPCAGVDVSHKAKGKLSALELAKKRKRERAGTIIAALLAKLDPTAPQVTTRLSPVILPHVRKAHQSHRWLRRARTVSACFAGAFDSRGVVSPHPVRSVESVGI